jgi:hypothetical protein
MGLEYTVATDWTDESVTATSWFDECLWKSYTWSEYEDDIDEVGPDDSGLYDFP